MNPITIQTVVKAPIAKVWECWNKPEHITGWAFASDDWEAPSAENDLRVGGKFKTRMQAKDPSTGSTGSPQAGSGQAEGFDFTGTYIVVRENELIEYDMDESLSLKGEKGMKRHVKVEFSAKGGSAFGGKETPEGVQITTTFDPENENSEEMQRQGWQAILDNFKKYVENKK